MVDPDDRAILIAAATGRAPAVLDALAATVDAILAEAVRTGAADVHFEPFERELRIRCRVDGTLRELSAIPVDRAATMISRLKVLAELNIAETRMPQDGRIRLTVDGRKVDLRLSSLPTRHGESVVVRILDSAATALELGQLGMPAAVQSGVLAAIGHPHGLVVVTGPTGSGKTTTLYACLRHLNSPTTKILTVEDPVEYELEGLVQVPVNPAANLTFPRALRCFLRQDPDVVMVGEIRDAETARIAVQASLTGHLVLTTLHTNDSLSAIARLTDMGIEPFLLASTLEAVVAQRLLRRVCPACRRWEHATPAAQRVLELDPAAAPRLATASGCERCGHTGYRGRVSLFEFLRLSDDLRQLVAAHAPSSRLRRLATAEGLVPLRDSGRAAVLAGETTLEELLRHT